MRAFYGRLMPLHDRDGPPTAKREQVQAAVLAATESLLAEGHCYADLDVGRITERAGISRTAFYLYFKDKRDLLTRLVTVVDRQLYEEADIWFSGAGAPDVEVREALTRISAVYRQHGPLLRAIVEVSGYDDEVAAFWHGLLERFVDASQRRIEDGGNAAGPARDTAFALVWMTERTLYQQVARNRSADDADVVAGLAGVWLRAVYG